MCRIAVVQHGDYLEAQRIIDSGRPEPYFAMAYSVRVLREFLDGRPHLVISLDAPGYCHDEGPGRLLGLPIPPVPRPVPRTLQIYLWGRQVRRRLREFRPTHLLLRTADQLGWDVLRYSTHHGINTLAIFAAFFNSAGLRNRLLTRSLVRLLNHPSVFLVGNHRAPATQTMVENGLDPRKAVAWDWPGVRHPRDFPAKTLPAGDVPEVVYVGGMIEAKGVSDLLEAVARLRGRGVPVRLTLAGSGPDLARFEAQAAGQPAGLVTFTGRIANEEAFGLMRRAALVCVPSRHEFREGFPLTLTEALASRTPVIISDHPVFVRAFRDGQGVRYFRAADPESLADAIRCALEDPDKYARLSEETAAAFAAVECPVTFGDLLERWRPTLDAGG